MGWHRLGSRPRWARPLASARMTGPRWGTLSARLLSYIYKPSDLVFYSISCNNVDMETILTITIKDCEVQHFRSGGKGGQNQNKVNSGSRVIHHPSGARGESREFREQLQNTRAAFRRMAQTKEFQTWARMESLRRLGVHAEIERRVDESMRSENLLVEVKSASGRWVPDTTI